MLWDEFLKVVVDISLPLFVLVRSSTLVVLLGLAINSMSGFIEQLNLVAGQLGGQSAQFPMYFKIAMILYTLENLLNNLPKLRGRIQLRWKIFCFSLPR